jgi:pyruvate formate-lyase activating enzyme-like uncharacterized protein
MKKLRLLITEKCKRNCPKCQNLHWNLKELPHVNPDKLDKFDEIILTGGEPMLVADRLIGFASFVKVHFPKVKLYLYTADTTNVKALLKIMNHLDGLTITIHGPGDLHNLLAFHSWLNNDKVILNKSKEMSLRIHTFNNYPNLTRFNHQFENWLIKTDKTWKPDKHLPENEVFMRLTPPNKRLSCVEYL